MIKLNIGGAKGHLKLYGWVVVDIRENADIQCDLTKERLPYKDNEVDIIYCSHMLEHIYRHDLKKVLDEFYRVLKPGLGICRIVVPDIKKACFAYLFKRKSFFLKSDLSNYDKEAPIGGLLADWFYSFRSDGIGNGHVHCFDYEYLKCWLSKSGFNIIVKSNYKKSSQIELRIDGLDLHEKDSLYVEVFK